MTDDLAGLIQDAKTTARVRYIAARRLAYHQRFSTWVVAGASLSLAAAQWRPGFHKAALEPHVHAVIAVVILVYTLLLGLENWSAKSERMHRCGIDLDALTRTMQAHRREALEPEAVDEFAQQYATVLAGQDNHALVDFLVDRLQRPDGCGRGYLIRASMSVIVRVLIGFSHYLVVLGIVMWLVVT